MRDRNTGDPRGFAFVVFKSDETVELVMNSGPHEINNKIVDVKRAQARYVGWIFVYVHLNEWGMNGTNPDI
jgi:hypothetical protein